MTKTILVTGCAGFIGTNLCLRLLKEGHTVVGLDNFYSGQRKNVNMLYKHDNFVFHKIDVSDFDFAEKFNRTFKTVGLDEIYHLACPASPPTYQKNPIQTMLTCVVGTKNILDLANKHLARFLFTSTSEIYGDPEVSPQPETYCGCVNSLNKRANYDNGKRAAETLIYDYKRMFGLQVRVARLFNFFGEFMDINDGRVVTNFIEQALSNKSLTVFGDGTQTRSFGYISDCVDGLIALMNSNYHHGPVNIGNTEEIPVLVLAAEVLELTNSQSKLIFEPLPDGDPKQRRPDISLAKRVLNWEPKVSRVEGLKKTIEYFKRELNEQQD